MRQIKVHMTAKGERKQVRFVGVPCASEILLTLLQQTYYYGQIVLPNEYPVCVGDVIEIDGSYHLVLPIGYKEITKEEFEDYLAMHRSKRYQSPLFEDDAFVLPNKM